MGASLVVQVLANWSHLSDRAFRVLVRMAVTALDKPQNGQPAAIYHGGRELLAMSLRSEKGTERTRNRAVAKAVAELTEAGAIQHLVTGWAGQNAVYRLTLGNTKPAGMGGSTGHPFDAYEAVEDESVGGPKDHPEDGSTDHPMDGPSGTKRVVSETTPRNQEEITKERGEEVGLSTPSSHSPRARAAEPSNPDSPPRPNKCTHGLGGGLRPDGLPECAICRVELRRAGPTPEPDPPPPPRPPRCEHGYTPDRCSTCLAEQDIAPVYDLASRRTA